MLKICDFDVSLRSFVTLSVYIIFRTDFILSYFKPLANVEAIRR